MEMTGSVLENESERAPRAVGNVNISQPAFLSQIRDADDVACRQKEEGKMSIELRGCPSVFWMSRKRDLMSFARVCIPRCRLSLRMCLTLVF